MARSSVMTSSNFRQGGEAAGAHKCRFQVLPAAIGSGCSTAGAQYQIQYKNIVMLTTATKQKSNPKATVPRSVIDKMKACGADYSKAKYRGRDIIKCTIGDDAAQAYLE